MLALHLMSPVCPAPPPPLPHACHHTHCGPFSSSEPSLHCQPPSAPLLLRPTQYESPWLRLWAFSHRNSWETCQTLPFCRQKPYFLNLYFRISSSSLLLISQEHKLCHIYSKRAKHKTSFDLKHWLLLQTSPYFMEVLNLFLTSLPAGMNLYVI